jgi:arginine repressor
VLQSLKTVSLKMAPYSNSNVGAMIKMFSELKYSSKCIVNELKRRGIEVSKATVCRVIGNVTLKR